jgi:hypothetical protein
MNYEYTLEKGSKKHSCPNCGKASFVRYVDSFDNYIPEIYGRCDRETKCTYHLNPYKDGYATTKKSDKKYKTHAKSNIKPTSISYSLPDFILKNTLMGYDKNIFIRNLMYSVAYPFDNNDIQQVIEAYQLGTIIEGYMKEAVTFPFIDNNSKTKAIQVKLFDSDNHTTKTSFIHSILERHYQKTGEVPSWLHSYCNQEKKVTCLFGEHLLSKYPNNPVALVEAPKTAVIGTLYFGLPDHPDKPLWLAVYNKSSLTWDKVKVLKNRRVVLYPDLGAFSEWNNRMESFKRDVPTLNFKISDFIEKHSSEEDKLNGMDLADYLINHDWRIFRATY